MTSTDETHYGWKNRETWLINLHLSNDRGLYESVNEIIEQVNDSDSETKRVDAADAIQELCESLTDTSDLMETGELYEPLAADLIRTALGRVDWFEIAESWDEEAAKAWAVERGE